jgi:hypothetical protein
VQSIPGQGCHAARQVHLHQGGQQALAHVALDRLPCHQLAKQGFEVDAAPAVVVARFELEATLDHVQRTWLAGRRRGGQIAEGKFFFRQAACRHHRGYPSG